MVIQHNLMANNSNRCLKVGDNQKAKSIEKLSSGYKINRAADDAAGLSISEKMRKQIRGLNKGIENTEDGISLCQVADGALAEVQDMLHRINELAVKAANGTNSDTDREAINEEVSALLAEIDRVGETTRFNELYVFGGTSAKAATRTVYKSPNPKDVYTFDQVKLDAELVDGVFTDTSSPNYFGITAKGDNGQAQKNWDLLFGNSYMADMEINYQSTSATIGRTTAHIELSNQNVINFNYDAGAKSWSRTYSVMTGDGLNLEVTQKAVLGSKTNENQYYTISYEVKNNSNSQVTFDFLHHEDTAFNNDDHHDSYYMGGDAMSRTTMYTTSSVYDGIMDSNIHKQALSDFSVANLIDNLTGFTENIVVDAGGLSADTVVMGQFYDIRGLDVYKTGNISSVLGQSAKSSNDESIDLGFGLVWHGVTVGTNGTSQALTFKQGIKSLDKDANIKQDLIEQAKIQGIEPVQLYQNLWIQSGAETMDGLSLQIGYMNAEVLEINELDVLTEKNATSAIDKLTIANAMISAQRSLIGAEQNRLEHTVKNEANVVENTTASESVIRDTDMAEEMVRFSLHNVLSSANYSMLTQANQSTQGLLSLIAA